MDPTRAAADPIPQAPPADVSRREVVVRLGAGGVAAFLLAAGARPTRLAAQDATPAAAPAGPVGVKVQVMGAGQPASVPGLALSLLRITVAHGGEIPAHRHPGALVLFLEAGTWGYTPLGGTVRPTRAAVGGAPTPSRRWPSAPR